MRMHVEFIMKMVLITGLVSADREKGFPATRQMIFTTGKTKDWHSSPKEMVM